MPITTTLGQLAAAAPALARLAAQPVPIATAYRVAKLAKLVGEEADLFTAQRNALIREFGEERAPTLAELATGASGPVVQVTPAHTATFTARLLELAALETTLAADPIDLTTLDDAIHLAPADLLALGPLLKDPA